MMRTLRNLAPAVLLFWLAATAVAADLTMLTADADAIVVGSIHTRLESADLVSFDLLVDRVVKGDPELRAAHVSHSWIRRGVIFTDHPNAPLDVVIRGLWFLKHVSATHNWDVLPAGGQDGRMMNLCLPAVEVVPQRYGPRAELSSLDAAIVEVAAGAEAAGSRRGVSTEMLKTIKSPAMSAVISAYLSSPDRAFQISGLSLALALNDPNALGDLVGLWPLVKNDAARGEIATALRDSYRDVSPSSVTKLAAMAVDPEFAELRKPAIQALASIHTLEALPVLSQMLDSTDPEERMKGVFGLSSFANGCPVQRPENVASMDYLQEGRGPNTTPETIAHFAFRRGPSEQESELITFWRRWWGSHEGDLMKNR